MNRATLRDGVVAALLATFLTGPALAGPNPAATAKPPKACDLLTTADVAAVAPAEAPQFVAEASGLTMVETEDYCVWRGKGSPDPLVQLIVKVLNPDQAPEMIYVVAKGEYFGGGPDPQPVPGVGDEAAYRDFDKGKGGSIVVRRGATVFVVTGLLPKPALVELAKRAVKRL
jgi:hypothetical protein